MVASVTKDQINPNAQYLVVLNETTTLEALPDLRLHAGALIQLIGSAAIELYPKIDKINLLEEGEPSA